MANEIGVRLNGDNSGFRSMLDKSVADATKFGGEITGKVGGKLFELRDVSTAIATALGINIKDIADNIARFFSGMSKAEEEAFKKLEQVSDQLAETTLKNMRSTLTEEQKYQLNLKDREKLLNDIANNEAKNGVQVLKQKQDELALAKLSTELIAYESKLREEAAKKSAEALKAQISAREKEYQVMLSTLSAEDRIVNLKESIVAMQAVIVSGVLKTADAEQLSAQLQERKNQLVSEEAKLQSAKGEIIAKNVAAEIESMIKRDDQAREELDLTTQRKLLLEEISQTEQEENDLKKQGLDATEKIRRVEVLRGQLKEVEKKQSEANVEIAKLMLRGAENLNEEEKLRLQLLTGQATQKQIDKEITDLTTKALNGQLLPAEKERLAVLVGQSGEIQKQLAGMVNLTAAAKEFITTVNRRGSSYESQSTTSLEGVAAKLKSQINQLERDSFGKGGTGGFGTYTPPELYLLRNELDAVMRELNLRSTVGSFATKYGEDETRFKFGDTVADRALRSLQDEATKTRVTIDQILERLRRSPFFQEG